VEEVYSTGSAFAAVLQNRTVVTFGNPDGGMKIEPGAPEYTWFSLLTGGAIFWWPALQVGIPQLSKSS